MAKKLDEKILLYYPFFEIERENLFPFNIDHEMYLKVFSLLSTSIIIPPSHLIQSFTPINILDSSFKEFFNNGIFRTSYRKEQNSIRDFLEKKEEEDFKSGKYWNINNKKIAKRVINLLKYSKNPVRRNVQKQSLTFFKFIEKGLFSDSKLIKDWYDNYTKEYIFILKNEINKIKYNKGYAISKIDIENALNVIKKQIPTRLLKEVSKYIDHAYFFAGGLGNKSIIGYSPYFQHTYLVEFLKDRKHGTNLFYDPNFFCLVLTALDIISSPIDIKKMSFEEIKYLRNLKIFNDFIAHYKIFSYLCQDLLNENNTVIQEVIKKFSEEITCINKSCSKFLGTIISLFPFFICVFPFNFIISLITLLYTFIQDTTFNTKINRFLGIDRLIMHFNIKNRPFGAFSLILKNIVQEESKIKRKKKRSSLNI